MKKMMVMLLASVMAAGIFTTTAFAYTGDAVQENTAVSMQCFWNERKAPMQSTAKQNQKCRIGLWHRKSCRKS